jgi:hypothetical protein
MKQANFLGFLNDIGARQFDGSGGYLVPEKTREEISTGIRKFLVKIGIVKPKYRWFRMRDYLIDIGMLPEVRFPDICKEINIEDYYIKE